MIAIIYRGRNSLQSDDYTDKSHVCSFIWHEKPKQGVEEAHQSHALNQITTAPVGLAGDLWCIPSSPASSSLLPSLRWFECETCVSPAASGWWRIKSHPSEWCQPHSSFQISSFVKALLENHGFFSKNKQGYDRRSKCCRRSWENVDGILERLQKELELKRSSMKP